MGLRMLSLLAGLRNDALVAHKGGLWLGEEILRRGHELSGGAGAAVADYDLRRVLVGHHDRGARQSAAEGQRVVPLQGLDTRTSVVVCPWLVGVAINSYKRMGLTNSRTAFLVTYQPTRASLSPQTTRQLPGRFGAEPCCRRLHDSF